MKNLKLLFLVGFCLVFALGIANATIVIDENFNDGTPWTNLNWAYGVDNPTSAGVKGISIFRNSSAAMPATATLAYNMTAGNQQGTLVNVGSGKAWRLAAGEKIFWGQSGKAHVESGGGYINMDGGNITVAQIGVACDPAVLSLAAGTVVGEIRYMFGTPTTYTLTYSLKVNAGKTGLDVDEYHAANDFGGTLSRTLGTIASNKYSMLTTVWNGKNSNTDPNVFWGTIAKTAYTGNATISYVGSADGYLYPVGKGWRNQQRMTSTTLGTAVYSFLDRKPNTTTTDTIPVATDAPWVIAGKFDTAANKLLTWKISVPNTTSATIVVDDIYLENTIRSGTATAAEFKAGDYRMHEFDQTKLYRPVGTQVSNPQYVTAGLPVELSIFDLR